MNAAVPNNLKGYEVRERIGTGGFGAVYRAYQSTVGREVAIKFILPGFANQPDFIRRFETEAQLVARLEHPHITPLYDYWREPDGAYLVMRWLRGGSLREALQKGPFDLRSTALLLDQIAGALSLAHRSGVIHRDLKPGNILLDEDGNAYLADFGIAKDLKVQGSNTQPDAIVGSLDYISPEQARSEPVTPRTDIYSLGVMLFEILAGHHPFENISAIERLYKHINDPLPELTGLDDSIESAVNQVIQKATAKNPEHRYGDALVMAADFREAAGLNRTPTGQTVEALLTAREHEILRLIIDGHSNKEIAQQLTVTLGTVKWYVNQIYSKLHVRSRVQAIIRARELNLIGGTTAPPIADNASSLYNLPEPENPYKGLRAFQPADEQDFFGREDLVDKLLKHMAEVGVGTQLSNPDSNPARFLAVIGPSGSGKSSLVKAGLIPALWRGSLPGSEKWFIVDMLPGAHPLDKLEVALMKVSANQADNLNEQLARDGRGLLRASDLILPDDGSELVLVIDQFEEVFTLLEDEAERLHFLDLLVTTVKDPRSRVRIIVTLRADFYDRPLHYPAFGELLRSQMETVLPLSAKGLERAIAGPAERAGVKFETGLVAAMVAEMNYQAGALPLLQYALTELFERREGRLLTHKAYQEIGGAVGALAKRAEALYLDLPPEGQAAARQIFMRLVTLGEGVEDTRRRAARSELLAIGSTQTNPLTNDAELLEDLIDTYADYRLLSLDNDSTSRTPTVELAHEAILREWERLRGWLNDSRDEIKLQRQLSTVADEWRDAKQDNSFLLSGSRLETFEKWIQNTQLALTSDERNYVNASIAQRQQQTDAEQTRQAREKTLEKRSVTFLRGLVAVMFIALIGAVGLTSVAANQSQIAQRNATEAQNVALINGSQAALFNGNTDQAIALALQAVTLDPSSARAQVALSEAAYAPGTIRIFQGHTESVDWVEFSPDGLTAISASWDNTLILWDIQTGAIIHRFVGHTDKSGTVAFMPDGLSVISGSYDTTMILWDIQTGAIIRRFEGQSDQIWAVAVSPDGQYVASAGSGNNLTLWDIQTGQIIRSFEGHDRGIESVAFSSDGSKLLTASDDISVILWDFQTGQIIHHLEGHTSTVYSAAFSPDTSLIASISDDGWTIIWDTETGEMLKRFSNDQGGAAINDVVFSSDGRTLLEGGVAGVFLWDIESSQPLSHLQGHGGTVNSVALNPDGRTAVSAATDGTLRLWDLENGQIIRRYNNAGLWISALALSPDGHTSLAVWFVPKVPNNVILTDVNTGMEVHRYTINAYITTIDFSPDGQTALLGTNHGDGTPCDVILWDVNTGQEIRRFTGHPAGLMSVGFSPDGRTAISNDWKSVIILWDVATGAEIRRFEGEESDRPTSVMFSPDGKNFMATYTSGKIVLWDTATGTEIRHFEGHTLEAINFVFSDDGKRGFSGSSDTTTILWDVATGAVLHRFTDHSAQIPSVDITSDGSLGLAGSADGTTLLWDLNTGELIRRYNKTGVRWPYFLPDNHALLSDQNELWRIDATLDELLTWTCANRYIPELTCDQRALYQIEPLCSADGKPI